MHVVVTDSGVGGLSVVAYAERFVRKHGFSEPVKLTFANAAPANDYGYNSMPSREAKIETFDRFLRNVTDRFDPDSIYVACNTLSVLLPETEYFRRGQNESRGHEVARSPGPVHLATSEPRNLATGQIVPVRGIVETGAELLLKELDANARSVAMIFGTQTTIEAGTYPRILTARGVPASRIVSQACPNLADTISEDREGSKSASEIRRWVGAAIEKLEDAGAPVIAYLACTHYGYRRDLFEAAFDDAGMRAKVVNPNERAVDDLFGNGAAARGAEATREVSVEFVTRYAIPETTIEALSFYLSGISPKTVEAMRKFELIPDLF